MNNVKLKKKALYVSAFFFLTTLMTSNTVTMESELKHRSLSSNLESEDVRILMEQSFIGDCSICYEEQETTFIPCTEGTLHEIKICALCVDGCKGICPICRRTLITRKNAPLLKFSITNLKVHTTHIKIVAA